MKKIIKIIGIIVIAMVAVIAVGFMIPERKAMPCCGPNDYNHQSFWYWPWTGGVNGQPHTGVDIFGKVGTKVVSQTGGIVFLSGYCKGKAGNSVYVLGPKWRLHMYLHLNTCDVKPYQFVRPGQQIGTLGKTGNAATTPAHVHYGIATPFPYVWKYFSRIGADNQPAKYDWMKMFWLNPADHLPQ